MNYRIRPYTREDFSIVSSWWGEQGETGPCEDMLPPDSSYVLELHGEPALCVSLYLTNIKHACYVENFVGNPRVKGSERYKASSALLEYIEGEARKRGYKHLFCLAHKEPLRKRYADLGFTETLNGVSTFVKEVG